jgi:hypothetical protein
MLLTGSFKLIIAKKSTNVQEFGIFYFSIADKIEGGSFSLKLKGWKK